MAKGGGFYAVAAGRRRGVFESWAAAEAQVKGFAGARFKKFATLAEAQAFVAGGSSSSSASSGGSSSARGSSSASLTGAKREREDGGEQQQTQTQRQRTGDFYAVVEGRKRGVYESWSDVTSQTEGVARPVVRTFDSREAVQAYVDGYAAATGGNGSSSQTLVPLDDRKSASMSRAALGALPTLMTSASAPGPPGSSIVVDDGKATGQFWYAVAKGKQTGVFATWAEAKKQVEGMHSAKFKKFPTREEAEAFVNKYAGATNRTATDPDPMDTNTLVAFCDGSALQNGQRGCHAGYACIFPHRQEWNVVRKLVENRATNNRAEYFAGLEAIKRANLEDPSQSQVLYIFSDSMLLIRSMTEWVEGWKAKGWRKADGNPVMNQDILEDLLRQKGKRRVLWRHVKAHTGGKDWKSKWNDVADRSARDAASSA